MLIEKKDARKIIRNNLNKIPFNEKEKISVATWKYLLDDKHPVINLKEYKAVLSFYSMQNEVQTDYLNIEVLNNNTDLYLPKTLDKHYMEFYKIKNLHCYNNCLIKNEWGIAEPDSSFEKFDCSFYAGKKILVIVPGMAFKKNGQRLGHGNGYYDNYLSFLIEETKKYNILLELKGICFNCQLDIDFVCGKDDINVNEVLSFPSETI